MFYILYSLFKSILNLFLRFLINYSKYDRKFYNKLQLADFMPIPLSSGFLESIYSKKFASWNHFSPDFIVEYWNLATRIADEYEALAGIQPSQKRLGCLLEEIVKINYNPKDGVSFDDFFRQHLNGNRGYSLWKFIYPHDKVTSSYVALNQHELAQINEGEQFITFVSGARPLEYGIRIVHEDMHNHQYTSQNGFVQKYRELINNRENLSPVAQEAIDVLENTFEFFAHVVQGHFNEYFLDKIKTEPEEMRALTYCILQFPPSDETVRIIGDKRTADYIAFDSDFEYLVVFDKCVLPDKELMIEHALKDYNENCARQIYRNFDQAKFVQASTQKLVEIISLPEDKLTKDIVLQIISGVI